MSKGIPWIWTTWEGSSCAVSKAVGSLVGAMKCAILEKWSTMVGMVVLLCEGGWPVTKSKEIWDQERLGTGRWWRRPAGDWLPVLFLAQTEQAPTNSIMSIMSVGHQKYLEAKVTIRLIPGWQENLLLCSHSNTSALFTFSSRGNKQAVWRTPSWVWFRLLGLLNHSLDAPSQGCHKTGRWENVVFFLVLIFSGNWRESASCFTFLDPGLKVITKLNWVKTNDHQTWQVFSLLAICRYDKFFWSIQMINGNSIPSSQCCHSSKASLIADNSRFPTW